VFLFETWIKEGLFKLRMTIFVAHKGQKTAYFAITYFGRIGKASPLIVLIPTQKFSIVSCG
jgi:hypothetical protein